ncbi:MAG: hypothetical protein JXA50_08330 [Deltaproteobacteria bacterium]|nr:hypothetical protein [Deltaproteobacteria bacterium]
MQGKVEKPRLLDHRYYQIAGITIRLESDLPITDTTFHPKFKHFEVHRPGKDTITIRHHFFMPDLSKWNMGKEVYRKPPWAIYKKGPSWVYVGISGGGIWGAFKCLLSRIGHRLYTLKMNPHQKKGKVKNTALRLIKEGHIKQLAIFNHDYSNGRIYNKAKRFFYRGNFPSLSLFPTDQVLLAQVLAEREGCYIHASGLVLNGKGLLFVGHSSAGKSTMAMMLKDQAKILCDDRMIVRRWPDGFKIHGTWSHGDVSDVAADSAPLKAILFLKQDRENQLIPIDHKQEINRRLLACLIKPLVTAEWWERMLVLIDTMAQEVPCYSLHFNKDGDVIDLLRHL